jgi:ABC-type Fe3+/spermidine/putrescine transport system ATPase subunit
MTRVVISDLTKIYPGTEIPAVDTLNLVVESGKINALLGPSGCGKTTTMKMIAGILEPTSGDILFNESSVLPIVAERRGAVMVFQNHLLFPYMSVGDNVGFALKMRREKKDVIRKRVDEMLELVQLPGMAERRPKQLSGGQQQRVALARALIVEPNVLLLDEPLSNLDAHLRDEMRELIRGIQSQLGITTIFVTHDQEEAVVMADQIALMFDGVLQQYTTPELFYESPATERISRFFGNVNFIPGTYGDGQIETAVGKFEAPHSGVDNGPSILSIRPETIEISQESTGHNEFEGRVISHVYVGTHARYKVAAGDHELEVVTDPEAARLYHDGDTVRLQFPSEKIWVLPPTEDK